MLVKLGGKLKVVSRRDALILNASGSSKGLAGVVAMAEAIVAANTK